LKKYNLKGKYKINTTIKPKFKDGDVIRETRHGSDALYDEVILRIKTWKGRDYYITQGACGNGIDILEVPIVDKNYFAICNSTCTKGSHGHNKITPKYKVGDILYWDIYGIVEKFIIIEILYDEYKIPFYVGELYSEYNKYNKLCSILAEELDSYSSYKLKKE
jgi:hypothetical protein